MKIRHYRTEDAPALAELYVRSVEELGSRDYAVDQVKAWASLGPSPERLHALSADGRIRLVAVEGSDEPVAFADLEKDGHIHFFYCSPEAAGKGIASVLYDKLEGAAREHAMTRLYAEASEAARRMFLRKEFVVLATRHFTISEVPIHNYEMEKKLVR